MFEAVDREIHDSKYTSGGTLKANTLRTFWGIEPDHIAGKLILALVDYDATLNLSSDAEAKARADKCRHIAARPLVGGPTSVEKKAELMAMLKKAIAETLDSCRQRGVDVDAFLQTKAMERERTLQDPQEAILVSDDSKRQFLALAGRTTVVYRAILPGPRRPVSLRLTVPFS